MNLVLAAIPSLALVACASQAALDPTPERLAAGDGSGRNIGDAMLYRLKRVCAANAAWAELDRRRAESVRYAEYRLRSGEYRDREMVRN